MKCSEIGKYDGLAAFTIALVSTLASTKGDEHAGDGLERIYQFRTRLIPRAALFGCPGGSGALPHAAQKGYVAGEGSLVLRRGKQAH